MDKNAAVEHVAIIGLGLMGGSLAYALNGWGARVTGMDTNPDVCAMAVEKGAVSEACTDFHSAVSGADLVIFCVYAHVIPELVEKYSASFKRGAILTDICGVKVPLYEKLEPVLPDTVDYVGVHPMAGKEVDGFINADASIYKNTGFIITPLERTKPESINLMRSLANHIGVRSIAETTPRAHDSVIAYTSDLMHVSAAALCMDYDDDMTLTYAAGAFRDCTRVANINAVAWTELLMSNRHNTLMAMDRFINSLCEVRTSLERGDSERLHALLEKAAANKKEMQSR